MFLTVGAGAHDSPFVRCFSGRRGADPYGVAVWICLQFWLCGESISKIAFRRFESGYRPEKNGIVLRTMKSEQVRMKSSAFGFR